MTIEPYRVRPTTPQNNPKTRCMTTPWRSAWILGGLVPGVDVMAYMMHLPVAKWGRAFLERGLIEARFVKPVYDGEMAELRRGSNGVLSVTGQLAARTMLVAAGTTCASLPCMPRMDPRPTRNSPRRRVKGLSRNYGALR